ncbi:zinc finger protein 615-like isoform X1 [Bactrocera tryoni]|uniref:zinc finger protein 615-like isoform X1 n=1 Tax=Bactrocera tryoni TaxID=59916 RepID=UPI001A98CD75|nr:zinc finger protein 615-like isoform X1 [Bactrocera tryoni]
MDTIPTCRACLKTSLSYVDLETPFEQIELDTPLEEHSNVLITYMDCFRSCTQLTATDNEGKMPQNLCENCSFELGVAWNFIQKAIQSDKVLNNAIVNCKELQTIDDSNGYDNKYIEIETVDDRSVRLEGLTKTESNKENISQTEDDLKDYVAIQQFPNTDISSKCSTDLNLQIGQRRSEHCNCVNIVDGNILYINKISDLVENIAKEEERNNRTIKKSPSTNSMESEQYYFLELMDISENDEGKINVNSTECDNDVGKSLKEDSNSSAIYCSICLQSFEKYSQLSLHSQTHSVVDDETSICKICGSNVFKEDMPEHIKITHSNIIKCMYCNFRCPELNMPDHMHCTHSGPKNFVCNICGKIFTSLSILNSHLKYHQRKEANIKSDACEICSKRFSTKHYLRLHMEVHRNVRQLHQCNYCDKMYVSKIALDNHIRLHKGETIKCDECGKQFVRQYELNVHMRFHTRDYPFKCEICDKKFAIKGHLRTHMWRHQGLKLQCEECGKLFTSTKALQEHSFVHSEMPFPCSYCGRGYPSKQKFKVHLKTTHLIEFTEAEIQKVTKSQTPKPLQRKKLTLVQADSVMKEVEVKDSEITNEGEDILVELC